MKILWVVFVGLLLAAGSSACSTHESSTASSAPPVPVATALAANVELARPFEAGGVVRARAVATMVSRIMAEVRAVPVKPGDRVRAGQALVLLDARELHAGKSRAEAGQISAQQSEALADADRQAAEAALALTRATHQRIAELRAKNSATPYELDEAVAGLRTAEARLNVANARVAESRAAIDAAAAGTSVAQVAASYATLVAPFDGLVTETMVDPGNMASPGLPLVTVEDTRSFRLEIRLDESRASLVRVGDAVDLRLDDATAVEPPADSARPAVSTGRIAEIARMLDPGAHDFLVKVDLPGTNALRSGMFGRARFRGEPHGGLAVPESAVSRQGQLAFVFVVDVENRAHLRLVNASDPLDGRVEIRAGLVAGERVVLGRPPSLVDGALVTPGAGAEAGR
jgi:RND family efflux transporter MFP subunit